MSGKADTMGFESPLDFSGKSRDEQNTLIQK